MSTAFFYLLCVVIASRLLLMLENQAQRPRVLLTITAVQLAGLSLLRPGWAMFVLAAVIILINLGGYLAEWRWPREIDGIRIIVLIGLFVALNIACSPRIHLAFNGPLLTAIRLTIAPYVLVFAAAGHLPIHRVLVVLAGWLLLLNEVNIVIRLLLRSLGMSPPVNPETKPREHHRIATPVSDAREWNTGRVIGLLERTIVYTLVLYSQFTAIGFILAAKSFARFKDLDDRLFAEYVLIGTLLSASSAVLLGLLMANL